MCLFRPLKYITNITESESIQIMKIAQIIYNNYIKPDKTLDIYIILLNCRVRNCAFLVANATKNSVLATRIS